MQSDRFGHSATLLPDGRGPLVGGRRRDYPTTAVTATAEVYAPWTDTFTLVNSMATPRTGHTATLLPSGFVLLAGGFDGNVYQRRADLFDPVSTNRFSATGTFGLGRAGAEAVLMGDGQVLIAGGQDGTTFHTQSEVYHPADPPYETAGFEAGIPLQIARLAHTTTRLPDGRVLVTGGESSAGTPLSSAEVCDPVAGTCALLGTSMAVARARHTATLLPNGKVLNCRGESA